MVTWFVFFFFFLRFSSAFSSESNKERNVHTCFVFERALALQFDINCVLIWKKWKFFNRYITRQITHPTQYCSKTKAKFLRAKKCSIRGGKHVKTMRDHWKWKFLRINQTIGEGTLDHSNVPNKWFDEYWERNTSNLIEWNGCNCQLKSYI